MVGERAALGTIDDLVLRRARSRPGAVAVVCGADRLTYGELDRRTAELAAVLRRHGAGAEDVVAVHAGSGPDFVVAVLGVLRSGAAYLPLPEGLPAPRVAELVGGTGARLAVTSGESPGLPASTTVCELGDVPAEGERPGPATGAPAGSGEPDAAAYVIHTSGSTGRPKGVVVSHRAAVAHLEAAVRWLDLGPDDVVLQMAGVGFDVAVEQVFAALAAGARVVLRGGRAWGPVEVADEVARHAVTVADLPTALFVELTTPRHGGARTMLARHLRTVLVGGEALPAPAVARWFAEVGAEGPVLVNAYGPTEAVMTCSFHRVLPEDGAGAGAAPSGPPVGPRALHVVDDALSPVADGGVGELLVGGAALARGYLGLPALTAERFVPDPWGAPGGRLYRTGDRVVRSGPSTTFLGRSDDQVQVRGHRVEPGEVEATLVRHPGVAAACVTSADARLTGHVVPVDAVAPPSAAELTAWLADRLPGWMVPSAWSVHAALPVRASGKVDRAALLEASVGAPVGPGSSPAAGPGAAGADRVRDIWRRVLGVAEVGDGDRFLGLGGTSLLATRVQADLGAELGVQLPLRDLLADPSLAELAELVRAAGGDPSRRPTLPVLTTEVVPGGAADGPRSGPLSAMQHQVWYFDQVASGNTAYHAPTTIRLIGPLDVDLLEAALTEVVRRHEILRTTFELRDGQPVQVVRPPYPVRVGARDLRPAPDPRAAAEQVVADLVRVPFDLAQLPLVRWVLLRLADEEHELLLVEHHIVHDGWSFALLVEEVFALYAAAAGAAPDPAPPTAQYLDFVHWQRAALPGPAMQGQLQHWRSALAGAPERLSLPHDTTRGVEELAAGAVHRIELADDLCAAVRAFCRARGVTLFAAMTAGFGALLHRFTDQDELCIGSAYGNRSVPGTEGVLGMFVNPVVLRLETPPHGTFAALVDHVRAVGLDAQENQHLPFVEVVRALAPARRRGHNPLFAAMINFDDAPLVPLAAGQVSATYLERHNGTAKVDLSVLVVPRAERQLGVPPEQRDRRITMIWEYRTDLFGAATIARMAEAYPALLRAALADPDRTLAELELAGAPALPRGGTLSGATEPPPVHTLFEQVAAEHPDRPAVVEPGHGTVSYAELDRRADHVAGLLRDRGVGPEQLVGICLPRSVDWVVAALGVLKAGAAYLPMDADSPDTRIRALLGDADLRALVAERDLPGADVAVRLRRCDLRGTGRRGPALPVDPDALAYAIFTSGSTGRPKPVGITHRALARKYQAWRRAYDLDLHPGVHLQLASPAFDVCTGDVLRALLSGGVLVLCPPDAVLDPPLLADVVRDHGVDTVEVLPSVARALAAHLVARGERLEGLRLVAVGGEAWDAHDHRRLREALGPATRLLNVYGVTEVTVAALLRELGPATADGGCLPVGEPLEDVHVGVVDVLGRQVPVGVVGEIVLGGVGVARGYLGRPGPTADRFRPAAGGGRWYLTGDRGRHRPDGGIDFLGRADGQAKIRGFRVEPGEVEQALRGLPEVADAVVEVHADGSGNRLVGHVVLRPGALASAGDLVTALRRSLPAHLVPAVVVLPALPRTSSGKVDRSALPQPTAVPCPPDPTSRPPAPGMEEQVAEVWREVLGVDAVGADDDFFDLGGHSLLAAAVTARLLDVLGRQLSVRDLLAAPTVGGVAQRLRSTTPVAAPSPLLRRDRSAYATSSSAFDPPAPASGPAVTDGAGARA
ncbi:non-ribosomal peptide synthetase [Modestobacter sp. Leaf380]|uniref:non-ribosomal peptide synthetase n=1 Tax=Modestobacter sp. Leaf380 TaxID=1736356 RepID=UPI0006F7F9E4|nr:non-ribosomal peptide synthetase [Modestobacter sp. Leaf380]KQS71307.1 hypothetical protein ASG41_20075 [Modestobacter sp. Leaf380]